MRVVRVLAALVGVGVIASCASPGSGTASAPGSTVATSPGVPLISITASAPAQPGYPNSPSPNSSALNSAGAQASGSQPSPQQVVSAYIAALNAHDVARAKTYLTPQHAAEVAREVDSWFVNVQSITHVVVGSVSPRDAAGGPEAGYTQIVRVGVRFTLEQYHAESMTNGLNDWSYILVRSSDDDPWLIADEGMG